MKFCALVLELHLLQNFCHTHTQTDIFQKWSKRVQDVSKRVNPSKTGSRIFLRKQYFLLIYIEESKNVEIVYLIAVNMAFYGKIAKI